MVRRGVRKQRKKKAWEGLKGERKKALQLPHDPTIKRGKRELLEKDREKIMIKDWS